MFALSVFITLILIAALFAAISWFASLFDGDLRLYVVILAASGAFGGLICSLSERGGHFELSTISIRERSIRVGNIVDIAAGIGAAFGIFFVLTGWIRLTNEPSSILTLAGLGVVAGYGGEYSLSLLWKRLRRQLEEKEKIIVEERKTVDELALILEAGARLGTNLEEAEIRYMKVLETNPNSYRALAGLGAVWKRRNRLPQAIAWCTRAIEKNPNYAVAYYNRSCYKCLAGVQVAEVFNDLKKAIELDNAYREMAAADSDFNSIAQQAEFRELITRS